MDKPRSRRSFISTGAVSFVLIFVMLSLLTFAVLSLVSAQADLRLSQKSADRTTDYYAAENAASDILAGLLRASVEGDAALADYAARENVTLTDDRAAYTVPLGQDQDLAVEVALDGESCHIDRWQAVSRYEWGAADEPLNLLGTGPLPAVVPGED